MAGPQIGQRDEFHFTRRDIQRRLDELALALPIEQVATLADNLNAMGPRRLPTMWEVVLLHGFAGAGAVKHEDPLPSGKQPDIALQLDDGASRKLIADVATVSDAGLDEANPVERLSEELTRLARKAGLDPNCFGYDVRGDYFGAYGDRKPKLFLPKPGQLQLVMKSKVEPWIEGLAPDAPSSLAVDENGATFKVTYTPGQRFATGSHMSYDGAYSRDRNPLFNALKGKLDQLRGAAAEDIRMLIACEGDCALLRGTPMAGVHGSYTARDVAVDFLRQNSSVDFVLLVGMEEGAFFPGRTRRLALAPELIASAQNIKSGRLTDTVLKSIGDVCQIALDRLPKPVLEAYNAMRRLRESVIGQDGIGGFERGGWKVKLSRRAVQRLFAGEIDAKTFAEAHDWDVRHPNPFKQALAAGRLIDEIKVVPRENKDDDWLEFSFAPPDAAAGPFRAPESKSE